MLRFVLSRRPAADRPPRRRAARRVAAALALLFAAQVGLGGCASGTCGNRIVERGEACDGEGCCDPACRFAAAGTICDQHVGTQCSGASAACATNTAAGARTLTFQQACAHGGSHAQ